MSALMLVIGGWSAYLACCLTQAAARWAATHAEDAAGRARILALGLILPVLALGSAAAIGLLLTLALWVIGPLQAPAVGVTLTELLAPIPLALDTHAAAPAANSPVADPSSVEWFAARAIYLLTLGAMALWVAGAMVGLLGLALGLGCWHIRQSRIDSAAVPDHLHRQLQAAADALGMSAAQRRRVALTLADVPAPMVYGWINAVICLPIEAACWPASRCDAVLRHELAHVLRRDMLVGLLAEVAATLQWPCPLTRTLRRRMLDARERACDGLVLASGLHRVTYAGALLDSVCDLAARSARLPRVAALQVLGVNDGSMSDVEQRIRCVLATLPVGTSVSVCDQTVAARLGATCTAVGWRAAAWVLPALLLAAAASATATAQIAQAVILPVVAPALAESDKPKEPNEPNEPREPTATVAQERALQRDAEPADEPLDEPDLPMPPRRPAGRERGSAN